MLVVIIHYPQTCLFSRRSHSWGEIKEANCGSQLQVLALENEVFRIYIIVLYTCMYVFVYDAAEESETAIGAAVSHL